MGKTESLKQQLPDQALANTHFLGVTPSEMAEYGIAGSMMIRHPRLREMHEHLAALIGKLSTGGVELVRALRANILLTGPSGSGKELVLTAFVHRLCQRELLGPQQKNGVPGDAAFGTINCACLSEHLLEVELFGSTDHAFTGAGNTLGLAARLAGYGKMDSKNRKLVGKPSETRAAVLFLDEVGAAAPAVQAKLLRLVENRGFTPLGVEGQEYKADNLIIVSATNELDPSFPHRARQQTDGSPGVTIATGSPAGVHSLETFRLDLFYRLGSTFQFDLPQLDERRDEIPEIAQQFYQRYCRTLFPDRKQGQMPEALGAILQNEQYRWRGNGRQMHQVICRAMIIWDGASDQRLIELAKAQMEKVQTAALDDTGA
jgi:DNA-binding NtrC family response regulator